MKQIDWIARLLIVKLCRNGRYFVILADQRAVTHNYFLSEKQVGCICENAYYVHDGERFIWCSDDANWLAAAFDATLQYLPRRLQPTNRVPAKLTPPKHVEIAEEFIDESFIDETTQLSDGGGR